MSKKIESENANKLRGQRADIVASGVEGVDGKVMINHLEHELKYKTIMMTTGPNVLEILINARVLNRLYITQVQREIEIEDDKKTTVLKGGKVESLKNFELTEKYIQEGVTTEDGTSNLTQHFLVYSHRALNNTF